MAAFVRTGRPDIDLARAILNEYRQVVEAARKGGGAIEAMDALDRLADLARTLLKENP